MSTAIYPDLKGKIALVTGSSKALGAETARRFAASGAKVVVNGRDERAIENVAASIRAEGGECIGVRADVTSAEELSTLRATIRGRFGDVDVLAAFAGGLGSPVPVLDITEDQWRNTVNADLTGKFLTVKTFAPAMKEKRSGNIILMSSAVEACLAGLGRLRCGRGRNAYAHAPPRPGTRGRLTEEALSVGGALWSPLRQNVESVTSRRWWGSPSRSSSRRATDGS